MQCENSGDATPRIIFGLIVFTLGVLFLLDKLDVVEMGRLWDYWPLVFVGVGLGKLMQPTGAPGRASGAVFILVGAWWLSANLDLIDYHPLEFWPIILILIGGSILLRALETTRQPEVAPPPFSPPPADLLAPQVEAPEAAAPPPRPGGDVDARIHAVAILGGFGRKSTSRDFRGGDVTAIMGGCELDLRQASIASGSATINTFALWGGIEIRVPRDWTVEAKGLPLLGGFEDSTTPPPTPTGKVLRVTGMAVMGGVDIKN